MLKIIISNIWSRVNDFEQAELRIRWLKPSHRLFLIVVSIAAIVALTFNIDTVFGYLAVVAVDILNVFGTNLATPVLEPDAYPFWDSTMTVLSIVAMILMTRKLVENWLVWSVINVISVVIFYKQGVYAMSVEYIILLAIAINGSRLWIKTAKRSSRNNYLS